MVSKDKHRAKIANYQLITNKKLILLTIFIYLYFHGSRC